MTDTDMARAPDNDNDVKEILATNITAYRKKMKMSRAELAERIGITMAAVGQYERGTRTPQIDIVSKLANVFNVPVDVLIGHGAKDFDAVLEYRFEQASDLIQQAGFLLFETPEGIVRICQYRKKRAPQLQNENGIVSAKRDMERFDTLIEFGSRQAFISFVEYFVEYMFNENECRVVFEDYMQCVANGNEYAFQI